MKDAIDLLRLLEILAEKGVKFVVDRSMENGMQMFVLSPKDVLQFMDDPISVCAKECGVAKTDYLAWMNDGFSVSCSATTKRGKPCRMRVPGGTQISPRKWLAMQGQYCVVHSGDRTAGRMDI